MKRYILPILLLCLAISPAWAQKGLHLGAHAAANGVWLVDQEKGGDAEYEYGVKIAPMYGIQALYHFSHPVGIGAELNFIEAGGVAFDAKNDAWERKDIQLNYIRVPVMLSYTAGVGRLRFAAMAGPQFDFLTNARISTEGAKDDEGNRIDVKEDFRKRDIGLMLSGGTHIQLFGPVYLSLEGRMTYGLKPINLRPDVMVDMPNEVANLHNASLGLMGGLRYVIGEGF